MWLRVLALAVVLGGGAGTRASSASEPPLLPLPVPATVPLTSSFGEYRPGHYHGGLDFGAGAGTPVRAPADGWIFRVRASGVGYGRVIYLRLEDGRTLLFAHLSRFADPLARYLEAEQDRLGRYEVDLYPEPGAMPIAAGETIGWTGHSGAGPDHLHAEIRIGPEASVAVNPNFEGWSVADTLAPRLTRLRVAPAAPGATVNGAYESVVIPLGNRTAARVTVRGPVRFWVEGKDATVGRYRLAPYRVAALLDGDPMSEIVFDRFDWNYPREVERTFLTLRGPEAGQWIALFETPGLRGTIFRGTGAGNWSETLTPGSHELLLKASDAAGNRVEVPVTVEVESPDLEPGPGAASIPPGFRTRGRYLDIGFPAGEPGELSAVGPSGRLESLDGWARPTPDRTGWQIGDPGANRSGLWTFHRTGEAGGTPLGRALWVDGGAPAARYDAGILRIEMDGESLYEAAWIGLDVGTPDPELDLPDRSSSPVALSPEGLALRESITVEFPVPPGVSRQGLAVVTLEEGAPSFEGADTTGSGVAARIRRLGNLALLRDRNPPRIELLAPVPERGRIRQLRARIRDDGGVGVTWTGLDLRLEGRSLVAEWDPEAKTLTAVLRTALLPGEYGFSVEASDRVGNRSEASRTFTVN